MKVWRGEVAVMLHTMPHVPGGSIFFEHLGDGAAKKKKSHRDCIKRQPVSVCYSILLRLCVECRTPFQKNLS